MEILSLFHFYLPQFSFRISFYHYLAVSATVLSFFYNLRSFVGTSRTSIYKFLFKTNIASFLAPTCIKTLWTRPISFRFMVTACRSFLSGEIPKVLLFFLKTLKCNVLILGSLITIISNLFREKRQCFLYSFLFLLWIWIFMSSFVEDQGPIALKFYRRKTQVILTRVFCLYGKFMLTGRFQISPESFFSGKSFMQWAPEGRSRTKSMAITPFWFSTEHVATALTPFWLSADNISMSCSD